MAPVYFPQDSHLTLLTAIFSALFGLAFGSFLNVCISRLPRHESIVHPRSRCPQCHAFIRASDNLPLVSWLLLGGRCRHCNGRIPIRYPLVELTTAALFLLSDLQFGWTIQAIGAAILCFLLLGLAIMDAEFLLLPDAFTLPGIVLGIVYAGAVATGPFTARLHASGWALVYGVAAAAIILLIRGIYWLVRRREGMGLGDAKLFALIAVWLGPWKALLALFLGVIAAAIYGLAFLASHSHRENEAPLQLPLGSFLCAAALYALFEGGVTLNWYLKFFR